MDLNAFSLADFMPYRLAVLAERVSRRLSMEYERSHGLTVAEWRVLVHLSAAREVSVREIRDSVNMEKPRVSRAVARLEDAGLVKKGPGKPDGRLVSIALTAKGRTLLSEILPKALSFEARLLQALSEHELRCFCDTMERLHSAMDMDPQAKPRSGTRPDPAEASR